MPEGGSTNDAIRWDGSRWVPTSVLQIRTDGVDIGTDDAHAHNIQGQSLFFGAEHDVVLDVVGHASVDYLASWQIDVAGGQYPSFYGYGVGGDQYQGIPYWGSYPDDATGPQHGSGTTIDRRGIRTDERILAERGLSVYDVVRDDYLDITWTMAADGSIVTHAARSEFEPNA
jgi:hypothetical protein